MRIVLVPGIPSKLRPFRTEHARAMATDVHDFRRVTRVKRTLLVRSYTVVVPA
jgi:hypothetical protein